MADEKETQVVESMNWKGAFYVFSIAMTTILWLYVLLQYQGKILQGSGGIFPPVITMALSGFVLVAGIYYYVNKEGSLAEKVKGFSVTLAFAGITYGLLSVEWSYIMTQQVITTIALVSMSILSLLLILLDLNITIIKKLDWADLPFSIHRWDNAELKDVLIGLGLGFALVFGGQALFGSTLLIGVPTGALPGSVAEGGISAGVMVGSVALVENLLFISLPISFVGGLVGVTSFRSSGSEDRAKYVSVIAGVLASLFVVFPIAWLFHTGAYAGTSFSVAGVASLFIIWSLATVWRGNSVIADVSHVTYNLLVVLTGLAYASVTLI